MWRLQDIIQPGDKYTPELESSIHKTIKKVSEDFETLNFNTCIAALMSLLNEFNDHGKITKADFRTFLILLNPVAPHITEELWEEIGLGGFLFQVTWPEYDKDKTIDKVFDLPVQINGKVRGTVEINLGEAQESIKEKIYNNDTIAKFIDGKTVVKEIYVPSKIYNIVVK